MCKVFFQENCYIFAANTVLSGQKNQEINGQSSENSSVFQMTFNDKTQSDTNW